MLEAGKAPQVSWFPATCFAAILFIPLLPVSPAAVLLASFAVALLAMLKLKMRIGNVIFLIFPIIMCMLTVVSLYIDRERNVIDDYFEIFKYISIFLFLMLGMSLNEERDYIIINRSIRALSIIIITYGVLTLFSPGWFSAVEEIYSRERFIGKPITFFYSTYFAAAVYAILSSYCIGEVARTRRIASFESMIAISMILMIVFTQSRSAIFGAAILFVFYVAICFRVSGIKIKSALIFSLLLIISIVLYNWVYIESRLEYLFSGIESYLFNWREFINRENSSLGIRFEQVIWSLENNPYVLWGAGIGKGYYRLLESWPALYYYRYGIIAMFLYVVFWGFPVLIAVWQFLKRKNIGGGISLGIPLFVITLPFLSLSSVITDQPQLSPLFYTLIGTYYNGIGRFRA